MAIAEDVTVIARVGVQGIRLVVIGGFHGRIFSRVRKDQYARGGTVYGVLAFVSVRAQGEHHGGYNKSRRFSTQWLLLR